VGKRRKTQNRGWGAKKSKNRKVKGREFAQTIFGTGRREGKRGTGGRKKKVMNNQPNVREKHCLSKESR